jgi:GWxTD domain-containing protein
MVGDAGRAATEGHPRGGPLVFILVLALVGCGGARAPGGAEPPGRGRVGRPLETYQQLGLLAGPAHFPAVASFGTIGGPTDSTYILLGVSLPSSALRFQREPAGFTAAYRVAATFLQDSQVVKRIDRTEIVRVPTFAETGRTDESILFQDAITLAPGTYEVTLEAADANSTRGFRVRDTLDVPAYGAGATPIAQPIVVYEATARVSRAGLPDLIVNPRHTVPYGGAAPRVYLEYYGAAAPVAVNVNVVDESGTPVWSLPATIADGDSVLRSAILDLPASALPLGKLWVEVAAVERVAAPVRAPLVISISDQWMVANFDEVLDFIRYIASREEVDSLRDGSAAERRELWERFWDRRDPLPATPANEFRDEFFQRVRFATEQFSEPGGLPGWKTDRGEVFIVLGAPQFTEERIVGGRTDVTGRPNAIEWIYDGLAGGRLTLLFVDRTGFGRFELAPSSEAAFRNVAERMKTMTERSSA